MNTTFQITQAIHRRIAAAALTVAAGVLITLAAAGTAAATPGHPFVPGAPLIAVSGTAVQPIPVSGNLNQGADVALQPQPLPPGPDPGPEFLNRTAYAALNPQPLPPGPDPEAQYSAAPGF
jgi:hypothetical protein